MIKAVQLLVQCCDRSVVGTYFLPNKRKIKVYLTTIILQKFRSSVKPAGDCVLLLKQWLLAPWWQISGAFSSDIWLSSVACLQARVSGLVFIWSVWLLMVLKLVIGQFLLPGQQEKVILYKTIILKRRRRLSRTQQARFNEEFTVGNVKSAVTGMYYHQKNENFVVPKKKIMLISLLFQET